MIVPVTSLFDLANKAKTDERYVKLAIYCATDLHGYYYFGSPPKNIETFDAALAYLEKLQKASCNDTCERLIQRINRRIDRIEKEVEVEWVPLSDADYAGMWGGGGRSSFPTTQEITFRNDYYTTIRCEGTNPNTGERTTSENSVSNDTLDSVSAAMRANIMMEVRTAARESFEREMLRYSGILTSRQHSSDEIRAGDTTDF